MERNVQRKKAQWGALNENLEQWQSKRKWKNMPPMSKKKNQVTAKQNNDFPRSSAADLDYRHYKTLQALGKAVSWAMLSFAQSPCKKLHIVLTLANKLGCSTSQSPNEFSKRKKIFLKKQRQLFLIFMRNLIWHGKNLANVTGSSEELAGKRSTYKRSTCSVLWEKLIVLTCRLQ